MPLYEYECAACGKRFELIRKFSDPPVDVCAVCGKGPVNRLLSSPAIQFKGSGWYITDYAKKGDGGRSAATKSGSSSADGATGEAAKADAKSDTGSKAEPSSSASAKAGGSKD